MTLNEEPISRLAALKQEEKQRVYNLAVAGTRLLDADKWSVEFLQTGAGASAAAITRKETGRKSLVSLRGDLSSLEAISGMEYLQELVIAVQPLADTSGIENLTNLKKLSLISCENLTSLSRVFRLPELEELTVSHCPVQYLIGIGEMQKLTKLELSGTKITDLGLLSQCSFAYAGEQGGFTFRCFDHQITEFRALKQIPVFRELAIEDGSGANWTDAVKNAQISSLHVKNWQKQLNFAGMMMNHPEIVTLTLENCTELTNLNVLEDMPNLKDVYLTEDMRSLGDRVKGKGSFTLRYIGTVSLKETWIDGNPDILELVHESGEDNCY